VGCGTASALKEGGSRQWGTGKLPEVDRRRINQLDERILDQGTPVVPPAGPLFMSSF
jgi:hypothetical protein